MSRIIFVTSRGPSLRPKTATRFFKLSPGKRKRFQPMAQLLHSVGGSWAHGQDKSEIILAVASASRYFSIQFFASLEKWIGARNPVRIGSSCAAVTGYDFPLGQSPKTLGVKAGTRQARSQNICPVHLIL